MVYVSRGVGNAGADVLCLKVGEIGENFLGACTVR